MPAAYNKTPQIRNRIWGVLKPATESGRFVLADGVRKRARYVTGRPVGAAALPRHDAESDGVAGLQRRLDALQIVGRIDRMLVDRNDDVTLFQLNVVSEGVRVHRYDFNTTGRLQPEGLAFGIAQVLHHHAEAGYAGLALRLGFVLRSAELVGEDLGEVADHHLEVLVLAAAHHADIHGCADRSRCHGPNQVSAIVDGLTVDARDDVAFLKARLLGRTAGGYRLHKDAFG